MRNIRKGFLIRREKNGIINAFSVEDLSEPLSDELVVQLKREQPEVELEVQLEVNLARPGDELKNVFDPKRVSTTSTVYESIPDCDLEDPHLHIITEESSELKPEELQPMKYEDLASGSERPEVDHEVAEDVSDSTIDPLSTIEESPEDNLKYREPEEILIADEKNPEEAEGEKNDDDDEGFFAKMKKHFVRRQSSSSSSSSDSKSSKSSRSSSPSRTFKPSKSSTKPTQSEEKHSEPEIAETKKFDERIDFNRIYINRNHQSHLK